MKQRLKHKYQPYATLSKTHHFEYITIKPFYHSTPIRVKRKPKGRYLQYILIYLTKDSCPGYIKKTSLNQKKKQVTQQQKTKGNTQLPNKHMEMGTTSSGIRKKQIKMTTRHHRQLTMVIKIKETKTILNAEENGEQPELSDKAGRSINLYNYFQKLSIIWQGLLKVSTRRHYDPAIPFLVETVGEMCTYVSQMTCSRIFKSALCM